MSWVISDRMFKYFLATVQAGSVRSAAETLHVAASAVSRQIIEMEAAIGQPLLERGPKGVVPTEAGLAVARHARRQADEVLVLQDQLRRLQGVQEGLVRIACGGGFLADLLDQGLAGFATDYPGIRFNVSLDTTDGILSAIAQGEADIGLAYNPPSHPDVRSVVSARQPLLAVLPPGHPTVENPPVLLRHFATEPAVLLPPDHGVRQLLGRIEAEGGFHLVARLETASFDLHRRFILAGLGVGFLPRFVVAAELKAGTLCAWPLQDAVLSEVRSHLLLRTGRRLPEAPKRLLNHLAQHLTAFQAVASLGVAEISTLRAETADCCNVPALSSKPGKRQVQA